MTTLDVSHYVDQIYKLDKWLNEFPLTQEYRERTTFREFHALIKAKDLELGLTPEVMGQLNQIRDNKELDMAMLEYSMTMDERELMCDSYYEDLPMNFYWMPEYEAAFNAVEAFIDQRHEYEGTEDEALLKVVLQHLPTTPVSSSRADTETP